MKSMSVPEDADVERLVNELVHPDDINELVRDWRTAFLLKLMKDTPAYCTLVVYHGMGHWLYVHKERKVYRAHVGEPPLDKLVVSKFLAPFVFYESDWFVEETYDLVYVGVSPQDFPEGKKKNADRFITGT